VNRRMYSMLLAVGLCANAQDKKLEFDVASVRVVTAPPVGTGRGRQCSLGPAACLAQLKALPPGYGGPGSSDAGRMTFRHVSMETLLLTAFAMQPYQISAPDSIQEWLDKNGSPRYDIEATVPSGATRKDAEEMLKNLLVERFGLVYHMQKRDFDAYRLTVAKGGPKLQAAASVDGPQRTLPPGTRQPLDEQGFPVYQPGYPNLGGGGRLGVIHFAARTATAEDLLIMLAGQLRVNVLQLEDKTGLTGKYDFKFEYADPRHSGPAVTEGDTPIDSIGDPAPDLFTALEKQLGLKLEKIKVPTEMVVIDHLNEQPTDN
jgi:uncharacterized protein (TIGR03435 family)